MGNVIGTVGLTSEKGEEAEEEKEENRISANRVTLLAVLSQPLYKAFQSPAVTPEEVT
jgi:hypothetical protein